MNCRCSQWALMDKCDTRAEFMAERCRASCGLCKYEYDEVHPDGPPSDCLNQHESCEFWAGLGECGKNPGYMLTMYECRLFRSPSPLTRDTGVREHATCALKSAWKKLRSVVKTDMRNASIGLSKVFFLRHLSCFRSHISQENVPQTQHSCSRTAL